MKEQLETLVFAVLMLAQVSAALTASIHYTGKPRPNEHKRTYMD